MITNPQLIPSLQLLGHHIDQPHSLLTCGIKTTTFQKLTYPQDIGADKRMEHASNSTEPEIYCTCCFLIPWQENARYTNVLTGFPQKCFLHCVREKKKKKSTDTYCDLLISHIL